MEGEGEESAAAATSAANDGGYDCNICLELAVDPVVTRCGHLFCWPCLYRWLATKGGAASTKECPVCKSAVEESTVVPIYGRGKGSTDPRTKVVDDIPNRPSGRRTELPSHNHSVPQPNVLHSAFNSLFSGHATTAEVGNVRFVASFGIFPSLFGISIHGSNSSVPASAARQDGGTTGGTVGEAQEALLSRLLIFLAVFVLLCLCLF